MKNGEWWMMNDEWIIKELLERRVTIDKCRIKEPLEWRTFGMTNDERLEWRMTIDEWRIVEVASLRQLINFKIDSIPYFRPRWIVYWLNGWLGKL